MITAAFQNFGGKVYFFGDRGEGGEYVRYDATHHRADPNYPKSPIATFWAGLPFVKVDAAFHQMYQPGLGHTVRNGYICFFRGVEYVQWRRDDPHETDLPTLGAWGVDRLDNPWVRVDAAFQNLGGTVYLFNGNVYVRCSGAEYASGSVDSGYPKTLSEGWGLDWPRVNAAFQNPAGTIYLFNEYDYVRYSAGRQTNQGPDDGYPKSIAEGWGPVVASL